MVYIQTRRVQVINGKMALEIVGFNNALTKLGYQLSYEISSPNTLIWHISSKEKKKLTLNCSL